MSGGDVGLAVVVAILGGLAFGRDEARDDRARGDRAAARPARRRVSRALLATALVLAAVAPAHALSGAEWRRQPEEAKRAYVDGVIDAWNGLVTVQESLGGRDRGITVFADVVNCLRDRLLLPPQIFSIVERHVEDNPGLRSKDMADIIYAALSLTCRR